MNNEIEKNSTGQIASIDKWIIATPEQPQSLYELEINWNYVKPFWSAAHIKGNECKKKIFKNL